MKDLRVLQLLGLVITCSLHVAPMAVAQAPEALFVDLDGDVGVGTSTPSTAMHLRRDDGSARLFIQEASATSATRTLLHLANNGNVNFIFDNGSVAWNFTNNFDFTLTDVGDAVTEFRVTPSGSVFIAGSLTTGGPTCGSGCDRVFSADYSLPSIEQHAADMWARSHLPAVGPTPEDGEPFNLTEKTGGILNELEKAHIYIAQLHESLTALEGEMQAKDTAIADLQRRLAALEEQD